MAASTFFEQASKERAFIFMELEMELKRFGGDDCRIEEFEMREGSILMSFVAIGTEFFKSDVGQIVLDASRFEALVKSLNLFASQIVKFLRGFFNLRPGRSSVDVLGIGTRRNEIHERRRQPHTRRAGFESIAVVLSGR